MKNVFFVIALTLSLFSSCVFDHVSCFSIKNCTNDTILICYARYNNIDSVDYIIGNFDSFSLKFDEAEKIILYGKKKHYNEMYHETRYVSDATAPDSCVKYCEPCFRNTFFVSNLDGKGYFFILKLEIVQNYSWKEICKNKLYETAIVSRKILKENNWKINYYSKESKK